jgi:hypothetical protein
MTFKNQSEMFKWIWENRPHVSQISGKLLLPENHPMWHWQFAHVLPKGAYPSYKLNSENIMLMLPSEHEKQESFEKFKEKKQELKEQYYRQNRI